MKWVTMLRALPRWRQVIYVLAVLGAFALLIWDILDKDVQYLTLGVMAFVVIAEVALRAPTRATS